VFYFSFLNASHNVAFRPLYGPGAVSASNRKSTSNISGDLGGIKRPVLRADNLTSFMCRLSGNRGASTFWKPEGLSRAVRDCLTFKGVGGGIALSMSINFQQDATKHRLFYL